MTTEPTEERLQQGQNLPLAVAWTVGTLTPMLLMGISGRELAAELQPHHSAFYRNAICLLILLPIAIRAVDGPLSDSQ